MFFYSPNARLQTGFNRRPTLSQNAHAQDQLNQRLLHRIPELLSRRTTLDIHDLIRYLPEDLRTDEYSNLPQSIVYEPHAAQNLEICASPVSPTLPVNEARRQSRQKVFLRRPTISIQEDGKIVIGKPLSSIQFAVYLIFI
ncbi:hypothetical protein KIN20_004391 [Parelaphostrongylus tenuis]|uniref:Uncharacterized protein n=1 Tax=Parelaphostrongylus tenuis TaxID=148309 RepID=A0AAD5M314_PARTN|nr:hypothetical protein KIN20_004391 [Parelaphostrongylus tenuis]